MKLPSWLKRFVDLFKREKKNHTPTPTPDPVPDTPATGTPNPRPTASEAGLQSQQVKWKVDDDGKGGTGISRTVIRWPSFLSKAYAITSCNSVTTIDGARAEFYKFDKGEDGGNNRASYTIPRKASTFAPNCQVTLWVNNVMVAGFKKADVTKYVDFDLPTNMEDVVP